MADWWAETVSRRSRRHGWIALKYASLSSCFPPPPPRKHTHTHGVEEIRITHKRLKVGAESLTILTGGIRQKWPPAVKRGDATRPKLLTSWSLLVVKQSGLQWQRVPATVACACNGCNGWCVLATCGGCLGRVHSSGGVQRVALVLSRCRSRSLLCVRVT